MIGILALRQLVFVDERNLLLDEQNYRLARKLDTSNSHLALELRHLKTVGFLVCLDSPVWFELKTSSLETTCLDVVYCFCWAFLYFLAVACPHSCFFFTTSSSAKESLLPRRKPQVPGLCFS